MKILSVFGTRPEAIKMAPVVKRLMTNEAIESRVCVTGQHRSMLDQALALFSISPEYDLQIMRPGQSLQEITCSILTSLPSVLDDFQPDCLLVHGDTSTSFCAALSAFYKKIPVAHVEAGLRTGDIYSPWPEEANRQLTSVLANLHFAPTASARANLLREGVDPRNVLVTGNTVIDSLLQVNRMLTDDPALSKQQEQLFPFLRQEHRLVLITGHRRENFGAGFDQICDAIGALADAYRGVDFVYPVHLNPSVYGPVSRTLSGRENVHLIPPQEYLPFIYLMSRCVVILTDSGGIQEEAPSLGKPVVVMRDTTERPEAVSAGTAMLVGTNSKKIFSVVSMLLDDSCLSQEVASKKENPYGDGLASARIVARLVERFSS